MARRHRMTPKRRAALRKAQLASAKKRKGRGKSASRSRIAKRVGIGVAGSVALGGAALGAAFAHSYVRQLKGGPKRPANTVMGPALSTSKEIDLIRVQAVVHGRGGNNRQRSAISFKNAGRVVGGTRTSIREFDRNGRRRGNYNNPVGRGIYVVGGGGSNLLDQGVTRPKQARSKGNWNAKQREIYGKKVAALAKKLETKRRRQAAKRQPKSGRKG